MGSCYIQFKVNDIHMIDTEYVLIGKADNGMHDSVRLKDCFKSGYQFNLNPRYLKEFQRYEEKCEYFGMEKPMIGVYNDMLMLIKYKDSVEERIVLPSFIQVLRGQCVADNDTVKEIYIPDSCQLVMKHAVVRCSHLETVYVPYHLYKYESILSVSCNSVKEYISHGVGVG